MNRSVNISRSFFPSLISLPMLSQKKQVSRAMLGVCFPWRAQSRPCLKSLLAGTVWQHPCPAIPHPQHFWKGSFKEFKAASLFHVSHVCFVWDFNSLPHNPVCKINKPKCVLLLTVFSQQLGYKLLCLSKMLLMMFRARKKLLAVPCSPRMHSGLYWQICTVV